jgi:hypothetical protein
MQRIDEVCCDNTKFAEKTITKAVETSKSGGRPLITTLRIGTGLGKATATIQNEASVQIFTTVQLPGEQGCVL